MTTDKQNIKAIADGVERSWDFWLSDRPITVGDAIEEAVKAAFSKWLASNEDRVIAAIAQAVADRVPQPPSKSDETPES